MTIAPGWSAAGPWRPVRAPTSVRLRFGAVRVAAVLLAVALCACGGTEADAVYAEASDCPDGAPLGMGGAPAARVLLNAYFLQEETARALRRGEAQSEVLEEVLAKASAMGVFGVRTAAYNDAADKVGDSALQIAPLEYDETAFRALDLVLARASVHDVRLVLPLGNYWDAYGGARRYVQCAGERSAAVQSSAASASAPSCVSRYRLQFFSAGSRHSQVRNAFG